MGAHKHNPNAVGFNGPIIGQIRKIAIATPAGDMMKTITAQCRERAVMHAMAHGFQIGADYSLGTYVEMNQNFIVKNVLDTNADALWLIDSDMTLIPETLPILVSRGKPIVGCNYRRRMRPRRATVKMLDGSFAKGDEKGLQEVMAIASGMLLIRTSVLRSMKYPWFWNYYGEKFEDFRGNDYNFCLDAAKAGHKIWCDFDLSKAIGHFADEVITLDSPE